MPGHWLQLGRADHRARPHVPRGESHRCGYRPGAHHPGAAPGGIHRHPAERGMWLEVFAALGCAAWLQATLFVPRRRAYPPTPPRRSFAGRLFFVHKVSSIRCARWLALGPHRAVLCYAAQTLPVPSGAAARGELCTHVVLDHVSAAWPSAAQCCFNAHADHPPTLDPRHHLSRYKVTRHLTPPWASRSSAGVSRVAQIFRTTSCVPSLLAWGPQVRARCFGCGRRFVRHDGLRGC